VPPLSVFVPHTSADLPVVDWLAEPVVDGYGTITLGSWGGWLIQTMPMIFNDRLVLTPDNDPTGFDYGWCYPKGGGVVLAAWVWDPGTRGEPAGFVKAIRPFGVRRAAGETRPGWSG
jgi:hypothetical protein